MSNENTPGLQDALDQMDIRNLISRYCWAIDKNDRELFSQVFAPEATADLGNVHCVGIDAIWARIRQALGSALPLGELCVPILVWVEKFRPGRIPAGASSTGG